MPADHFLSTVLQMADLVFIFFRVGNLDITLGRQHCYLDLIIIQSCSPKDSIAAPLFCSADFAFSARNSSCFATCRYLVSCLEETPYVILSFSGSHLHNACLAIALICKPLFVWLVCQDLVLYMCLRCSNNHFFPVYLLSICS